MTDQFIAIPVGQGDAFFLQRGDFTALIDGGRAKNGFPSQFFKTLKRQHVNVLVCTHNDADHANGILGFLEYPLGCDEVWLPALWMDRLDDLLMHPDQFFRELSENIVTERIDFPDRPERDWLPRLDLLGDHYAADYEKKSGNDKADWDEARRETIEAIPLSLECDDSGNDAPSWSWILGDNGVLAVLDPFGIVVLRDQRCFPLLFQALRAAERIRDIAVAATDRGIPIRWFRYSSANAHGRVKGRLIPVNAHEVARSRPRRVSALEYLALTTSNKLSLVFCSPRNDDEPGVLFAADSDLQFSAPIRWHNGMIVTTPHHGSEANRRAYTRFATDTGGRVDVTWVRSDGNFKSRPGPSYLKQANRVCTLCRGTSRQKEPVGFELSGGRWNRVAGRPCTCI